jgi:ATP-binding cassette, subfamily B, multidrug efflux pump
MSHLSSLVPYFRPYRRGLWLGLFLVAVGNVFTVLGPWILRLAIDALDDPTVTRGRIAGYAGMVVLVALLGGAARYGMRELLNGISRRIECDLRSDFFRHLLRLDASFFSAERTGDIMSRATNDTLAVRQAAGPGVMYAVNTSVMSVFTLSVMVWISPRLTLLALIPMLLLPPAVLGFGRLIHTRFERIQEQFSRLSTQVQENLTGIRLVRAYVQEVDQARRFDGLNREYIDRNMALAKIQGLFHPIMALLTGIAMVVVLWFGGREVMAARISVGDFVAFIFYLNLLTWPMVALGWVVNLFQRGEASMGRINAILSTEPRVVPGAGLPAEDRPPRIEFRNVSFRYPGSERNVLEGVSFRVEPGETVALVGPTGSGKSTVVSLLPRLYDPTEGEILLDGTPLTEFEPGSLRRRFGMVPQDAFLFTETIGANVGLGLEPEAAEAADPGDTEGEWMDPRVLRAARMAQLHEQVEALPRGYGTRLGERGINLSGGQKQRATLARALARDPAILVLDDALSAVDTQTESRILAELREALGGERTSFLISHRVTAVMGADRILVLDGGRLVEEGTHEALLARSGVYASLLRRQLLEQDLEDDAGSEPVLTGVRSAP